jgi:hypothetical protein
VAFSSGGACEVRFGLSLSCWHKICGKVANAHANSEVRVAAHAKAERGVKALMPEDAEKAIGHGVRAKRSKSGTTASICGWEGAAMRRFSKSIGAFAAAVFW